MKRAAVVSCVAALAIMAGGSFHATAQQNDSVIKIENPLGPQGAIGFRVQTDTEYHTGPNAKTIAVDILEIPEIAKVRFSQSSTVCELQWVWARGTD